MHSIRNEQGERKLVSSVDYYEDVRAGDKNQKDHLVNTTGFEKSASRRSGNHMYKL